jgi:hypothetical protein
LIDGRHADFDDVAQPHQPGQLERVTLIVFDPIAWRSLQFRRCRDLARNPLAGQIPIQAITSRAGLVGHAHRLRQRADPGGDLVWLCPHPAREDLAGFAVQATAHHRSGVHIQPDTHTLF